MNARKYLPVHQLKKKAEKRKRKIVGNPHVTVFNPLHASAKKPALSILSLAQYANFIYDQGQLGSCTACAFCAAFRIRTKVQRKYINFLPSPLFFYYNERVIEDTVQEDAGADVVDGEAYAQQHGVCSENKWPYIEARFAVKPTPACYAQALQYKIKSFQTITQLGNDLLQTMKTQLSNQTPLLIAIAVYDSFESSEVGTTGIVPIPNITGESCLGGHEMCVIGYDDTRAAFFVQNSWGNKWGLKGRCYIPYAYITNPELCFEVTWFIL